MNRGVSPAISVVMLIAISAIVGISVFFWAAGIETPEPIDTGIEFKLDATIVTASTGTIEITNTGTKTIDAQRLYVMENSSANCTVGALAAGDTSTCTLGLQYGMVSLYGENVTRVTVVFPAA